MDSHTEPQGLNQDKIQEKPQDLNKTPTKTENDIHQTKPNEKSSSIQEVPLLSSSILNQSENDSISSSKFSNKPETNDPIINSPDDSELFPRILPENLISNKKTKEVASLDSIICLSCKNKTSEKVPLPCGHDFCSSCLLKSIQDKINSGKASLITCLNTECLFLLPESIIQSSVTDSVFFQYQESKKCEIFQDPFIKLCPTGNCEGYGKGIPNKRKLTCNLCSFEFCFLCLSKWHPNENCKISAKKYLKHSCPKCRNEIKKKYRLNHLKCPKCSYEWCLMCGSEYSSFHLISSDVKKLKKIDPHFLIVLGMAFCPLAIPFLSVIFFCFLIFLVRRGHIRIEKLKEFSDKNLILSYFLAVFIGILLTPLFFAFAPLVFSAFFFTDYCGGLVLECPGEKCKEFWLIFCGIFFGVILSPFLVGCFFLVVVVGHVLGVVLLGWKLCLVIIRCGNPRFLVPRSKCQM